MSQKQQKGQNKSQKQIELDFFQEYLQKKVRNANKKLKQIAELEIIETDQLKDEQKKKIATKKDIFADISEYKKIETFYNKALKEQKSTQAKQHQVDTHNIQTKTIRQILDLTYLAQFYEVNNEQLQGQLPQPIQDLKALNDFYHKTLVFNQNIKNKQTVNDKLEKSIDALQKYVKGDNQKLLHLAANSAEMKIFAAKKGSEVVQLKETTQKVEAKPAPAKEKVDETQKEEVVAEKKEEIATKTEGEQERKKSFVLTKLDDLPESKRKKTKDIKKNEQQKRKKTTDQTNQAEQKQEGGEKQEFVQRKMSKQDQGDGFVEIKKRTVQQKKYNNYDRKKKYQGQGGAQKGQKNQNQKVQYVKKEFVKKQEETKIEEAKE